MRVRISQDESGQVWHREFERVERVEMEHDDLEGTIAFYVSDGELVVVRVDEVVYSEILAVE